MSRSPSRRRQRSVRATVAAGLLVVATVVAVVALVTGSTSMLAVAAVVGPLLGWAALRILRAELRHERQAHARDRARQAQSFEALLGTRSEEHRALLATMTARLATAGREVQELRISLRRAEGRVAAAEGRVRREARLGELARTRVAELESQLALREEAESERPAPWPVSA